MLRDPVRLPYLFTTGPSARPTTGIVFKQPQRVPPIRALAAWAPNTDIPVGVFDSRSKRGAYLDGALLRFEEPAAAEAILLRAGATSAGDLTAWFERYRTVVSDPRQRAEIVRRQGMITWLTRSVYPLLALPILMGILSKRGSYSFVVGAAVAAITVIAITRVAVHRMSEPRP